MGDNSAIQWTNATWNPVVGCSPVSEGCRNCYAARHAIRLAGNPNPQVSLPYLDTAEKRGAGEKRRAVFTGKLSFMYDRIDQPLRWRRPRRVFVNSMSDLFHPDVPTEFIAQCFAVMAIANQHTYQVLTKRPKRAADLLSDDAFWRDVEFHVADRLTIPILQLRRTLPHLWIGASVEDQEAADERIPHLIETPAAVRFLSCEPLLGPVDLSSWIGNPPVCGPGSERTWLPDEAGVDWVIVGGESGPGARPCEVAWIRSIVDQCKVAGVPVFVKQLGARPMTDRWDFTRREPGSIPMKLRDRKGGDPSEWPEDLQVREFPASATMEVAR